MRSEDEDEEGEDEDEKGEDETRIESRGWQANLSFTSLLRPLLLSIHHFVAASKRSPLPIHEC